MTTDGGRVARVDGHRSRRPRLRKLYTTQGNWDIVGNNIPVFFIQDGIKFPDFVHSVKPEPDREIPQAQSAHDTFWDFVSLQPESTHMLMWVMSDRAILRSYRTMEGFGVHTFRLVNADGETSLVKFHWKPTAGIHSLVWEESQKLGGIDPDFHRRDLWNAIESGAAPQWDLGVQVMPDNAEQTFEGIDLLDATKLVPEELCPVRLVGRMTLDANPANYFAETEQVAFHPGHLVPGIDLTNDPLMHARLFSYLDTQLTRIGGPNFAQLPINRPAAPVNDNLRDGFGQQAVHTGRVAYSPNSISGGCPFATAGVGALRKAVERAGAALQVIAPHGGTVKGSGRSKLTVDATVFSSDSVVYDALVVAAGTATLDPKSATMLQEAYRHHKTLAAWGSGVETLAAAVDAQGAGVITGERATKSFTDALIDALGWHRHWER